MIAGMYEQDFIAYVIFGLILNFIFSIFFGVYLSKNIGMQEMIESKGNKEQSLQDRENLIAWSFKSLHASGRSM